MRVVLDSSTLAKRYIHESGSASVSSILQQTTELGLSILCVPEVVSAMNRRRREGLISANQYAQIKAALALDVADTTILDITPLVVEESIRLLEGNVLRAMDALHVACALVWQADLFVSADQRQVNAAQNAGLTTQLVR
jgi:predicted nucleic acid-binding protein